MKDAFCRASTIVPGGSAPSKARPISGILRRRAMAAKIVGGKAICLRCKEPKLPGEMHSIDVCEACYKTKRAENRSKPKPKNNNSKNIKRNKMGWIEQNERPRRQVDAKIAKQIAADGYIVSETGDKLDDTHSKKSASSESNIVSDTGKKPSLKDLEKSVHIDGIRVSETENNCADNDYPKSIAENGIRVSDTEGRLDELERALGATNESLANALRKIRALEEKLEKLSPIIEKEEAKRDASGLQKLRDDLFKLLRERMEKSHTNGIYVHSLYGKNGRRGGKLNISKMQAFRLRDACRGDDRFKVEKTENQQGNWAILLNIHMRS